MDSAIPPTELGIVSPGECNLEMQHIRVAFESCSSSFGNLVWVFPFSVRWRLLSVQANSYPPRALCASASTSSVDIAVMSWAVANGLLRVKLLGTPFDGQSAEP